MKKSNTVLENENIAILKQAKEVDAALTKERAIVSEMQKELHASQKTKLSDNSRFQRQIQDLIKEKTALQEAINKTKQLTKKIDELLHFFITKVLKPNGTFPKFKWYNIGKVLQIITFLAIFIPELIAIFKKK